MRHVLRPHPDSRPFSVSHIEVEVARANADSLVLSYLVTGDMSDVHIASITTPTRSDGLWRHTCFEAFIRASSDDGYYEFNFAPSTQWAAYWFSSHRHGMRVAAEISEVPIEVHANADAYKLQASLRLDRLSGLPRNGVWHLGLSAVIEDTGGRKSYWALVHPPGQPDFHHADCFAYELLPTVQS